MNRIFKVIWSKAKNCYVVASELAKSHTKSPKSGIMSCALVAGVLACVLSCVAVMPAYADTLPALYDTDNYSSGGSVSVTGSTASSNAFTNVSNSTNVTVNGDISASNFSVIGSPSDQYQQYIPAGTGTFVCKANNTNVKTVTVSGIGLSNFSDTITFNERRFASIVDFIHYIDSTSTITSVAPGNTYYVGGTSLSGNGISSGNLYSNGVSYNGSPYLGGNGGVISVIYDSSGRIYLGGSSGKAGIVGIQGADGKALVPSTSSSPGFLVELVNKGDYYETKTLLAQRGLKPGETEGLGTYSRTYATVGEELSIVGDYSPTLTVSGSSSLSVTGSANLEDGSLRVSDNSSVSVSNNLSASKVSLSGGSTVTSGGTLSAKSVSDSGAGTNTFSAASIQTTEGDINTPNTDVTASDSIQSAGAIKAKSLAAPQAVVTAEDTVESSGTINVKSLSAPMLRGTSTNMSTLGGGLTVAGQVKGVTAGTDDTDVVNVAQLNSAIAGASTPYIGINSDSGSGNEDGSGAIGTDAIAIGPFTMVTNDNGIALGRGAGVFSNASTAVGYNSFAGPPSEEPERIVSSSTAIGSFAYATGNTSVSLGYSSRADGNGSVALGSESVATVSNVVSVGHSNSDYGFSDDGLIHYSTNLYRRIINVDDGIDNHDVATWGQTKVETRPADNGNYVTGFSAS